MTIAKTFYRFTVGNAIGHLFVGDFFRCLLIGGIVVFAIVIDLTVCGCNILGNWLRVANIIVIIRFCVISSDAKILPPKKFIDHSVCVVVLT